MSSSSAHYWHISGGIDAIIEVLYAAITAVSVGIAVLLLLFARDRRFRLPWVLFASFFLFIIAPITSVIALNIIEDPATALEPLLEFYTIGAFVWVLALLLLSKANNEDRLKKQNFGITALNEMAKSYLMSDVLTDAARSSLDELTNALNADGGLIFAIHRKEKRVEVLASFGNVPKHAVDLATRVSLRTATDGKIIQRMVKMDADLKEMHERYKAAAKKEGFKSIVGFPIRSQEKMFGMLVFFSKKKMRLSDQDRAILNLVAFELGRWMAQISNIASMRRMSEIKKGLFDTSLRLQQELTSEEIMHFILEQLNLLIPSMDLGIYLYNPAKETMWTVFAIGKYAKEMIAEGEFPLSEAGITGEILRNRKAEIVSDVLADGRSADGWIEGVPKRSAAFLGIPLLSKGQAIGVIELHREHPKRFVAEDLEVALLFAQQASVAIENAGLMADMEREKDRAQLYLDLLSHDIANLNTPLCSYFDMLIQDERIDAETRQTLAKANDIVDKMNALLSRIRKISKTEQEGVEELKPVSLNKMLQESVESLRKAFPRKKLEITINSTEPEFIALTGEMLDEIFFNILHNAVKFSPGEEVKIEIALSKIKHKDRLSCAVDISDYGRGIPDEEKEEIFLGSLAPAASFARGFGIGLSTCRKFVEQYGGSLWVTDRAKGEHSKGACFVVILPLAQESS